MIDAITPRERLSRLSPHRWQTRLALCFIAAAIVLALMTGCAGSLGNIGATDPTERGLSYVAAAIVTAAIIRAFFNK